MTLNYHTIERQVSESIDRALIQQIDVLTNVAITEILTHNPEVKRGLTTIISRLIQRTLIQLDQEEAP
jgi:hypothetical protein